VVKDVWLGIRRTFGVVKHGKAPLLTDDVRAMVATLGARPPDARDRAIVLMLYAGAFRRSELAALDVADITVTPDGLIVEVRWSTRVSPTTTVVIPFGSDPATCPVRAYRAHLAVSGITTGAVFRAGRSGERLSGRAVADVVQRLAKAIGKDVAVIGAHSLRAGMITQAIDGGEHEHDVMHHARYRSSEQFRSQLRPPAAIGGSSPDLGL
jgi:integrase